MRILAAVAILAGMLSPSLAMTFDIQRTDSAVYLRASGDVAPTDGVTLREIIPAARESGLAVTALFLDSDGGDLDGGIDLGRAVRELGMDTLISRDARCFSACSLAFFGGVDRMVFEGGQLGVHQFVTPAQTDQQFVEERAQYMGGVLMLYFEYAGISPLALVTAMTTPPAQMHVFTRQELRDFNIVTLE